MKAKVNDKKYNMEIKKISEIKNLGTFTNFQWINGCNDFKRYNFFYGWNYSGKTTLSRIFRCLEDKKTHPDFPNASFKVETDADNITEKDIGKDFNIRVFNEEFVEDNFKWNDNKHEINPVLLLGKESAELEEKVKELTQENQ
ncbi:MAG TPA: AAA family ATPase, partial [bacterium]|nr:AAA family ATPase [bacterium]